ncbi:MAG TPA: SMP-30/gluconolactonase/LRE family protein [Acidimicrobiia bacterium]|jgi:gluconolactonase|nr:SMP-30/gluconolactonase/LRE family protein [Acidimicrobiia bacterium]
MRAEVVATGVPFGEGPVWCPDGTLVVTSVAAGALFRVRPEAGSAERFAETRGGANGATLAADGSILVTQNGGFDVGGTGFVKNAPPVTSEPATPGLQLATPDGAVSYLLDDGFHAPNDLCIDRDGTVFFTDPGHYPPPEPNYGRVFAYATDGSVRLVGDGFLYCNGIALDRDGHLVVIEARGLQRLLPDGEREWVIERLGRGGGDGFCLDADGRYYVASTIEHGVRVVDTDGTVLDFLEIDGDGLTTNCCFGGPDLRTLYATDAVPGNVVAWAGMPTPGLPLHSWPGVRSSAA